jgi:hypothetical protein
MLSDSLAYDYLLAQEPNVVELFLLNRVLYVFGML